MPRYSLNAFGRKIPLADTSDPLSKQVGRRLQGQPDTKIDSGGSVNSFTFDGQEISSSELREIREIRESGGVISALMRSKALLTFGAGVSFEVEENEATIQEVNGRELTLEEYLRDRLNDIDSLVLELGEDALYYPYAVAEPLENRRGGFGGITGVEPYTVIPETDEYGDIVRWIQTTENGEQDIFAPDELVHFPLNKSSARDKTGISSILRSREEIEQFRANQQAIKSAIELHGFPQRHVKVGREGSAPIRDNELRRVRNLFDSQTVDSDTVFVTGNDVEIDALEAENFEFERVSENDMRQLSLALGVPLELTNYGSDGLGSGKPAEFRLNLFKLQIEANQRQFANIFVRDLLRPVLRDMTPYNHTVNINMEFGDPLQTEKDMATLLQEIGGYMTNEEISERFDLPKPEDEEIADAYRTPAEVEQQENQPDAGGAGEGLFSQLRELNTPQGVPDNAQYLPPGESPPEGATTYPSEGQGSYYVPAGEDADTTDTPTIDGVEDIPQDGFSDEELVDIVDDVVPDASDVDDGDVTPEKVGAMAQALPDNFDESAFWEPTGDNPLPSKGQPIVADGQVGVMKDVEAGDAGLEGLIIETSDGTETVDPSDVTHTFDEDADPSVSTETDTEAEPTETDTADPEQIRENVSERPDVSDEVNGYVERAESPQTVAASFEDEIAVFGISEEEIVDGDADPPRFSTSGAESEEQAEEFTASVVEARERGWMDGLDGRVELPSNNLNLPEGAQGTFKPGVRNFAGEKVRDTESRKAEININPEENQEWDGEQEYIPFGPDEASKMEYAVSHEFGHSQHYQNLIEERDATVEEIESDEFQNELQSEMREHSDAIEEEFSALAASNPFEFAADTFSALAVGADVSDEVLEAYDKIGGVPP